MIESTVIGAVEMTAISTKAKFSMVVVTMMLIGGRMMVGVEIGRIKSMMLGETREVIGVVGIDGTIMIVMAMILIELYDCFWS